MRDIESRESAGTSRAPSPASSCEPRPPRTRKASRSGERRVSVTGQNTISRRLDVPVRCRRGCSGRQPLLVTATARPHRRRPQDRDRLGRLVRDGDPDRLRGRRPAVRAAGRRAEPPDPCAHRIVLRTGALLASALAPTFTVLLITLSPVGLTTVLGQLLVPLAGDLASDSDRGRVVGTVVSGILIGILVSRTVSGLIAGAAGWRAVDFLAAVLAFVLAILLFFANPSLPARASMGYPATAVSVFSIGRRERAVRWTLVRREARPSRCSLCSGHHSRSCQRPAFLYTR